MAEAPETFGDIDEELYSARREYYSFFYIDGFRSLQAFSVKLNEGLNVLVGPNGSGKTNFIQFLDFLSATINRGASNAISTNGGIARVFSQEALKARIPRIQAEIRGLADLKDWSSTEERTLFRFEYKVDIRYSKFHSAIFIAGESLKFKSLFWPDLALSVDLTVGSLDLRRSSPLQDDDLRWEVGSRLRSNGPRNPLRYRGLRTRLRANDDESLQAPVLAPDESFLSAMPMLPAVQAVRSALSRGRSFNLNPAVAKTPDDIASIPVIGTDGSGLSAVLYHMQQAKRRIATRAARGRRISEDMLDNVISWTSIVLPELLDVVAVADPHTGKYLVHLTIDSRFGHLRIPLQGASDGTVKWLAFVSLITLQGSSYSLEEPENFLHPQMQRHLISLIRESLQRPHPGYFIVSTHSETIINNCSPEELLLFQFRNGYTSCKRLDNPETVAKQINKTGFGLGYYYTANAIS